VGTKTLTQTEQGSLIGNLRGAGWPDNVEVYVASGIPQMFRRLDEPGSQQFEDSWLYLPVSTVRSLTQSLIVECCSPEKKLISTNSIDTDQRKLLPVLANGRFSAVLAARRGDRVDVDEEASEMLFKFLENEARPENGMGIQREFVRRLFHRDQSLGSFLKSVVSLLADQWPATLAGVYYCYDQVYQLRLALGQLDLSGSLANRIDDVVAREWIDSVRRGDLFVPAEVLPEYPTMLNHAPNFQFVHPAIESERTDHLLVAVVRGDLSQEAAMAMYAIANLAACIDENQFTTRGELLDLYSSLATQGESEVPIESFLRSLFEAMDRNLVVSRLVLTTISGPATVVQKLPDGEAIVRAETKSPLPVDLFERSGEQDIVYKENLAVAYRGHDLSLRYKQDQVVSEISIPVQIGNRGMALLAIGSPVNENYLEGHQDFMEAAARLVEIHLQMSTRETMENVQPGVPMVVPIGKDDATRDAVSRRICDGLLHAIVEQLSIVLGHGEIMEEELLDLGPGEIPELVQDGARKINEAADSIAEHIEYLRRLVVPSDHHQGQTIQFASLGEDLATVLSGCTRKIQAIKRIKINLTFDPRTDQQIAVPRMFVVRCLLPLLVSLYDEAISSGRVKLSAREYTEDLKFVVQFDRRVIGHIGLDELLTRVYSEGEAEMSENNAGTIAIEGGMLKFEVSAADECRLEFELAKKPEAIQSDESQEMAGEKKH